MELRLDEAVVVKEATADLILAVALWAAMVGAKSRKSDIQATVQLIASSKTHDILLNLLVYC